MARLPALVLNACIALAALVAVPRSARADGPSAYTVPVAVLAFDSEDAEEQADALTGALKSRIRGSHGWTLVESSQSLGMLTAALRCPSRPSPECQQKIAEHLKQDRYIWGFVTKARGGQVQAEVHLYQKGKPEASTTERYADNLKDPNDDALRKIAQRVLDQVGGSAVGVLVVRAGALQGEVVIDGEKRVPLEQGTARVELSPDSHSVELAAPGAAPGKRNVLVAAGKETVVELGPAAVAPGGQAEEPKSAFPTRQVLGGVAMAAGVGLGIFAVERYGRWSSMKDELATDEYRNNIDDTQGQAIPACEATGGNAEKACKLSDRANGVGIVGIASAAAGGVLLLGGAYLFFTGGSDEKHKAASRPATAQAKRPSVAPWLGAGTAGVGVSGAF